ncbi:MAG: FHA domain-containing protein [Pseudanabaenales cyanobacterium]|nr:FHA domain-containing protein [Pseudanabaenales cyanobacterium]
MLKFKVIYQQTGEFQERKLTPDLVAQGGGLIGRHNKCDVVLNSPDVSRVHARIIHRGGQYYFSDLGSTGGSTVNDEEAQTNQTFLLKPKDLIRIGGFTLLVEAVKQEKKSRPRQSSSGSVWGQISAIGQYVAPFTIVLVLLMALVAINVLPTPTFGNVEIDQLLHSGIDFVKGLIHLGEANYSLMKVFG